MLLFYSETFAILMSHSCVIWSDKLSYSEFVALFTEIDFEAIFDDALHLRLLELSVKSA